LIIDNNAYDWIIIDSYTDIYPILVARRVLTLTHLAAKDIFEDAWLVLVIIVTLCVIIHANTGTCTTCGDNITTKIGCNHSEAATPLAACEASSTTSTSSEAPARLASSDGATLGAPTSTLTAGQGGAG